MSECTQRRQLGGHSDAAGWLGQSAAALGSQIVPPSGSTIRRQRGRGAADYWRPDRVLTPPGNLEPWSQAAMTASCGAAGGAEYAASTGTVGGIGARVAAAWSCAFSGSSSSDWQQGRIRPQMSTICWESRNLRVGSRQQRKKSGDLRLETTPAAKHKAYSSMGRFGVVVRLNPNLHATGNI